MKYMMFVITGPNGDMETEPNRAIAVGFRDGWAAGLAELDAIDARRLSSYYLLQRRTATL